MCKSYFVLYTCDDFKQNLFDVDIFWTQALPLRAESSENDVEN